MKKGMFKIGQWGLWIGFIGLMISTAGAQQRGVKFKKEPPKPTPIEEQTLTGYEAAVALYGFMQRVEKGLTEATELPVFTGSPSAAKQDSKHPQWARKAVAELQARKVLSANFKGSQVLTRHQFAASMMTYLSLVDQSMQRVAGRPNRLPASNKTSHINLKTTHPDYGALKSLLQGGWLPTDSPFFKEAAKPLIVRDVGDMFGYVTSRLIERYTREPED